MNVHEYANELVLDINEYGMLALQFKVKLCALYVMNEIVYVHIVNGY